jgi:hypothetical protein
MKTSVVIIAGIVISASVFTSYRVLSEKKEVKKEEVKSIIANPKDQENTNSESIEASAEAVPVPTATPTPLPTITLTPTPALVEVNINGKIISCSQESVDKIDKIIKALNRYDDPGDCFHLRQEKEKECNQKCGTNYTGDIRALDNEQGKCFLECAPIELLNCEKFDRGGEYSDLQKKLEENITENCVRK